MIEKSFTMVTQNHIDSCYKKHIRPKVIKKIQHNNIFKHEGDKELKRVCKYCGKAELRWARLDNGQWRLFDINGNAHKCNTFRDLKVFTERQEAREKFFDAVLLEIIDRSQYEAMYKIWLKSVPLPRFRMLEI